jgi:hypothetical protein
MRKLLNGEEVLETHTPIDLLVHTKAPGKWKLTDMETGEEYVGSDELNVYGYWKHKSISFGHWIRIKDKS